MDEHDKGGNEEAVAVMSWHPDCPYGTRCTDVNSCAASGGYCLRLACPSGWMIT